MIDSYLRFPDQQTADDVLQDYEGSIDVIGEIEGTSGWHVNTRGPVTEEMTKYAIDPTPVTPYRIWA